jgi:hypothetical protein
MLGLTTLTACVTRKAEPARVYTPEELRLKQKYRGIYGGVLCFDSRGKPKKHVTMYLPDGSVWRTALTIDLGTQQFTFPGALYIPTRLRVEWRTPDSVGKRRPNGRRDYHLGFEGGTVLGDYTLEIADRIPDELLDAIRQNGGALRIKIRLMDDRVLLGWDIEKRLVTQYGRGIVYQMPGGDFFEGEWGDGKYVRKPWHIDSQGQRIETEED